MTGIPPRDPVLAQIRADADVRRFEHWATSTVIDENTGEPVLDAELFDTLHAAAGITAAYPIGNAGVLHVYGYWFSTALTPYGYKRDRWVDGQLARAFGLPPAAFLLSQESDPAGSGASPVVAAPTLLQRVVAVALPALRTPGPETVAVREAAVGDLLTRVTLTRARGAAATALVYGVHGERDWQLVTTFPVSGEVAGLLEEFEQQPRLRWNAARE